MPLQNRDRYYGDHTQDCPVCGAMMCSLSGGKSSVCENCGYKESCCY
ncbi:MAG: hypothetical protein WC505_00700 [Patescibacteria group bacterium]